MKHPGQPHLWFTEQQSSHKWCHLCHEHAKDSKGPCVEQPVTHYIAQNIRSAINAIAGPQTATPRGVR